MTIDLSTLKPGDRAHHRNGGVSVISRIRVGGHDTIDVFFEGVENCNESMVFFVNGSYCFGQGHPFDIVAIIPAPQAMTPLDEWITALSMIDDPGSLTMSMFSVISLAKVIRDTLKMMGEK